MEILLFLVLVFISHQNEFDKIKADVEWKQYKTEHSLTFNDEEDKYRREIFHFNRMYIEDHNAKNSDVKLKMNRFGHLRSDEVFMNKVIKTEKITKSHHTKHIGDTPVRKSIDWRTYGMVSPIKNQQHCGSCYAFSGIGAIESHYAIHRGTLPLLSEQEIVDCSDSFGNDGCYGGWPENVYDYAKLNGLVNQSFYPYTGKEGECRLMEPVHDYHVKSTVRILPEDENHLIRSLSYMGPVAVCMDVSFEEFRFYSSGILHPTHCSKFSLNHAILAVGYNLTGKPHYIVKNSWGTKWGEDGYFRIVLGENICGIASKASYPII